VPRVLKSKVKADEADGGLNREDHQEQVVGKVDEPLRSRLRRINAEADDERVAEGSQGHCALEVVVDRMKLPVPLAGTHL